ncbi:MAG: NAD-dependent succinate-semialdehyde dehydrogenase [Phycisphaerales bacterium]|nr:NAD-dependent succinate-semialdehyde dehydrogenase [Phycisphaerales bacterium]
MQTRNLVGGRWIGADDGAEFEIDNPATGEVIARVPSCGASETRRAIEAAAAALPEWRALTAYERAAPLKRLAELMLRDRDRLARLMTLEQGKPLAESAGEIAYAASFIEWAAAEAVRVCGETIPASRADKRIVVLRQPVGVTAAITPWNFPSAMVTRKLGPALACGCTMVVKPAEQTPLSALALGELAAEAGVRAGVLNIVTGEPGVIAGEIMTNPVVRKVSFTGSTEVGKILMKQAAHHVVRLSLELGGHAPFIVFDDADVHAAVAGAMASKFRNAGQTCICPNRVLVQRGVYGEFVRRLAAAVAALRVGPGDEEGVQVGPLIDEPGVRKVEEHLGDAMARGGRARVEGGRVRPRPGLTDRFFKPALVEGLSDDMLMNRQETFGPVLGVREFTDEREAIELANDSRYGLASYFYTRDAARLLRVAEALEYGIVGANDATPSTAQAPFGGVKESGFGREGGTYAMEEYLETKYVAWGGLT